MTEGETQHIWLGLMHSNKITQWLDGRPFDLSSVVGQSPRLHLDNQAPKNSLDNTCGTISYNNTNGLYYISYKSCNEKFRFLCQSACTRHCDQPKLHGGYGDVTLQIDSQRHLVPGSIVK